MNTNSHKGIIVIFHGSKDIEWVTMAHDMVKTASLPAPSIVCFLESYPGYDMLSIREGISHFVQMGIHDILVIPLFLSSFSTHLDDIRTILGVNITEPNTRMISTLEPNCMIQMCEPLNAHPIVASIVTERILELTNSKEAEPIVLIAHGVNDSQLYVQYEQMLIQITQHIQHHFESADPPFLPKRIVPAIHYATFYPDTIRPLVEAMTNDQAPIIIPLFLSEGFFTKYKIPQKLAGLPYKYSGKALLPHPEITGWLYEQVRSFLKNPS